jgi:DnaK suppressor protein
MKKPAAAGKAKPSVRPAKATPIAKTSAKVSAKASPPMKPTAAGKLGLVPQKKSAPTMAVIATRPHAAAGKSSLSATSQKHKSSLALVKPMKKGEKLLSSSSSSSSSHKNNNHKNSNHTPPPLPLPPVSTDGKPRKNQAGLSSKELEFYRELLLAKRRELVGDMSSMEREALRSAQGSNLSNLPIHMADMGTDNYEQEFTLGLVQKDRDLLRDLNSALAKIQDGTYGICEGTGKPISKVRLEAQPWARYSIEYARQKEKGFIR